MPTRVTLHFAQTLDGRIATRTGDSHWISGDEALHLAHRLRAEHEAVLVGVGTVLADDPRLTVRLVDGPTPARVILDGHLRIPLNARVLTDRTAPTIVMTGENAPTERVRAIRDAGAEVVRLPTRPPDGWIDLENLISDLNQRGLSSILVEGGSRVITSVLRARVACHVVVCVAPRICGAGVEAVGDLGCDRLAQALSFATSAFYPLGSDLIFEGTLGERT